MCNFNTLTAAYPLLTMRFVRFARVTIVMALTMALPAVAHAQHTAQAQPAAASPDEIHYLGKVNVNDATADELERVPGMSKTDVERILAAKGSGPITNLKSLKLTPRAVKYLRTEGASDFARIKKLPLKVLEGTLQNSVPGERAAPAEPELNS